MNFLISQIFGVCGLVFFISSMQQKNKRKILFYQIISFFFYSAQYLIIKAYPGMILFVVNMIRCIIFYYTTKKNKYTFILLIMLSSVCGIITYNNLFDIFPVIASFLSILFTWQSNIKILREGQIITSITWIIYDLFVKAYVAVISEIIIIFASVFAILRIDYNKDFKKIIFTTYLKIRFRIDSNVISLSPFLPKKIRKKRYIR